MRKEYFDQVTVQVEDEAAYEMTLTYYLLTSKVKEECGDFCVYGVEIQKESTDTAPDSGAERKVIKDLFFKKSEAMEFLRLISQGGVTPIGLKYVVKDYVYDKIHQLSTLGEHKMTENMVAVL